MDATLKKGNSALRAILVVCGAGALGACAYLWITVLLAARERGYLDPFEAVFLGLLTIVLLPVGGFVLFSAIQGRPGRMKTAAIVLFATAAIFGILLGSNVLNNGPG